MDHRPDKVTLEDLLHLKRAERPPDEFWVGFEGQLRQKQLAALLERRPWWHSVPVALGRRAYLPIGATAILAMTLVSVKYFGTGAPEEAPTRVAPIHAARLKIARQAPPAAATASAPQLARVAAPEHQVVPLSDRLPDRASDLTPWSAPRSEDTPSAKAIAASLAQLEQTDPDLANSPFAGSLPSAPARVQLDAGQPVVELATYSTQASKRSRLLAQLDDRRFTPEPQAPELVRERLARRLADSDFSDNFSRVGLERGGVSLRF